jgi:hypothetical protein
VNLKKLNLSFNPLLKNKNDDFKEKLKKMLSTNVANKLQIIDKNGVEQNFNFQRVQKKKNKLRQIINFGKKGKVSNIVKSFLLKFNPETTPLNHLKMMDSGIKKISQTSPNNENKIHIKAFISRKKKKQIIHKARKSFFEKTNKSKWKSSISKPKNKFFSLDKKYAKKDTKNQFLENLLNKEKTKIKHKMRSLFDGLNLVTKGKLQKHKEKYKNKNHLPYLNLVLKKQIHNKQKKENEIKKGKNIFLTQIHKKSSSSEIFNGGDAEEMWKKFIKEHNVNMTEIQRKSQGIRKIKLYNVLKSLL